MKIPEYGPSISMLGSSDVFIVETSSGTHIVTSEVLKKAFEATGKSSFVEVSSYSALPNPGDPSVIYLVRNGNAYDQYAWLKGSGGTYSYKNLGQTIPDVSNKVDKSFKIGDLTMEYGEIGCDDLKEQVKGVSVWTFDGDPSTYDEDPLYIEVRLIKESGIRSFGQKLQLGDFVFDNNSHSLYRIGSISTNSGTGDRRTLTLNKISGAGSSGSSSSISDGAVSYRNLDAPLQQSISYLNGKFETIDCEYNNPMVDGGFVAKDTTIHDLTNAFRSRKNMVFSNGVFYFYPVYAKEIGPNNYTLYLRGYAYDANGDMYDAVAMSLSDSPAGVIFQIQHIEYESGGSDPSPSPVYSNDIFFVDASTVNYDYDDGRVTVYDIWISEEQFANIISNMRNGKVCILRASFSADQIRRDIHAVLNAYSLYPDTEYTEAIISGTACFVFDTRDGGHAGLYTLTGVGYVDYDGDDDGVRFAVTEFVQGSGGSSPVVDDDVIVLEATFDSYDQDDNAIWTIPMTFGEIYTAMNTNNKIIFIKLESGLIRFMRISRIGYSPPTNKYHFDAVIFEEFRPWGRGLTMEYAYAQSNNDYANSTPRLTVYDLVSSMYDSDGVDNRLLGKADIENGDIHVEYPKSYSGSKPSGVQYMMNGAYQLVGEYCTITCTAYSVSGWQYVYYTLPVVPLAGSAVMTSVIADNTEYMIKIDPNDSGNQNCVNIYRRDLQNQSANVPINFTITYRYADGDFGYAIYSQADLNAAVRAAENSAAEDIEDIYDGVYTNETLSEAINHLSSANTSINSSLGTLNNTPAGTTLDDAVSKLSDLEDILHDI